MCPDCVRLASVPRLHDNWPPSSTIAPQTTTVEIDAALLRRLREHHPGVGDRELLEAMARASLGRETLRRVQDRSGLSEDEAIALGVEAVHEARQVPSSEPSI